MKQQEYKTIKVDIKTHRKLKKMSYEKNKTIKEIIKLLVEKS